MNSIISEAVDPENYKFSIAKLLRILSRAHFRGQQLCFVPATKEIVYAKLCANRRNNSQLCWANNEQCWKLLHNCQQWCANRCINSQQCWDLHCILGRIQPIWLWKPCVMSMRGPNNVGGPVHTDPTLLHNAQAITEQKKCWALLARKFDWFQTLHNNYKQCTTTCNRVCKWTQHVRSNNAGSCCPTMLHSFAWGLRKEFIDPKTVWDTNMDAALLFWDTNMVEVTSCKKAYATALLKSF